MSVEATASQATGRGPARAWWSLVALLVAIDLGLVAVNGVWLAGYLRDNGPPFSPQASELVWVHGTAIVLGLIVAIPALAVIGWLARRADVPAGAVVLAVLLGALVFLLAAHVNDLIVLTLGLVPGEPIDGGIDAVALVVAPAVEEPAKLLALAALAGLMRPAFGVRQGIVLGLAVGIGATLIEAGAVIQLRYADGAGAIYGTILAFRFGLFGLSLHATTGALTGAGLGYAVSGGPGRWRIAVLLLALAGAVAIHALWNLWASRLTLELLTALVPEPDFSGSELYPHHVILVASSVVTAILLLVPGVVLAMAWRRAQPPTMAVVSTSDLADAGRAS
jgi:RsiW-degrading membrane proteinase PrsW (M82 family)